MKLWRKGNPSALLVGMQTGAATVENSMKFTEKIKNRTSFGPSDSIAGNIPEESQNSYSKILCTPMFIEAQFTIAKCWKQPKCQSVKERIKKWWYVYTMECYTAQRKKEGAPTLQDSMDGSGEHYAK